MRSFPPELIYFLFFLAIFLFQYLTKKRRADQAEEPAPPEVRPAPVSYPVAYESSRREAPAPVAWSASPLSATEFGRRPEAAAPVRPRRRRRYSRQSLFGTPQDVRTAVVIATILGPCRALEPPGGEASSERDRRQVP